MGLSIHTAQASPKASCDTQLHNCNFGTKTITTAIEMVHLKIACSIRSALRFFHNMANTPGSALCDRLLAVRTQAILPSPNTVQLPTTSRRVQIFLTPSGFEILFPVSVMRICVGFNLYMPLYWRIRFSQQGEIFACSILLFFCRGKHPVPVFSGFKVFLLNPSNSFSWVPSCRPSP